MTGPAYQVGYSIPVTKNQNQKQLSVSFMEAIAAILYPLKWGGEIDSVSFGDQPHKYQSLELFSSIPFHPFFLPIPIPIDLPSALHCILPAQNFTISPPSRLFLIKYRSIPQHAKTLTKEISWYKQPLERLPRIQSGVFCTKESCGDSDGSGQDHTPLTGSEKRW